MRMYRERYCNIIKTARNGEKFLFFDGKDNLKLTERYLVTVALCSMVFGNLGCGILMPILNWYKGTPGKGEKLPVRIKIVW